MRILDAEAMREVDRYAIDTLGVPSLVLMENAAIGVADAVGRRFPEARAAAILCGPGNNGGDGLALARQLLARGYDPRVLLVGDREPAGDAGVQLEICRRLGLEPARLRDTTELAGALTVCRETDLVVDALFGTGLARPLEGLFAELVEGLAGVPVPCVAVDLPSGLSGSRVEALGPHVEAQLTVTFAALKLAHVFPPAAAACGEVVVADLGIPTAVVERAPGDLRLSTADELAPLLGPRAAASHKGDYGHLLVWAGSVGKSGAAVLAVRAAVRTGAGLVTAAVPAELLPIVEGASLESMAWPVASADELREAAAGKQALAVGPGLGGSEPTVADVRRFVLETRAPLVLDADGVNAFAGAAASLAERDGPLVLTPHPMEMARLLGVAKEEILADRPAAVRRAAAETGAVVVLKGALTLIAADGEVAVNPTGNPGMATGGTGDVLTGMLGGLLAQGYEPGDAARLGVYLHGLAGDLAAERLGEIPLAAADLLESLPDAVRRLQATA